MDEEFRIGRVKISMRLLGELLKLPQGCQIEGIEQSYALLRDGCFMLYVAGEGVPVNDKLNISEAPLLFPKYSKDGSGRVKFEEFVVL